MIQGFTGRQLIPDPVAKYYPGTHVFINNLSFDNSSYDFFYYSSVVKTTIDGQLYRTPLTHVAQASGCK